MGWTDQMVEDLRKMWKEGLTTGEIGKRLGVSKNSIVGKVHRLGLSGRPSPIKKKNDAAAAPAEKKSPAPKPKPEKKAAEKTTAAPQPKTENHPVSEKNAPHAEHRIHSIKEEFKTEPRKDGKVTLTGLDNHTCRWPVGDPKDENFHFCGKKVRLGQTYCEEHSALAYVKAGSKR